LRFSTVAIVTDSVGNSGAGIIDGQGVVLVNHNLVALAGGSGDSNNIAVGGGGTGRKSSKFDGQIVNLKRKVSEGVVNILETGFDGIAKVVVLTGGVLTDGVG